jgi:DNA-binding MarR family transcriptional regulator
MQITNLMSRGAVDDRTADALNRAIRTLAMRHRARALELLAPLGLYPGQEFVIMELAARGPAIQARIADAIGSEPPSVTLMVRKLEAAGYVQRSPASGDRRTTTVELTAAGRQLAEQIRRLWTVLGEQTLGDLDDPPADQIVALLNKLAASIAATPASAAADAISKRTAS